MKLRALALLAVLITPLAASAQRSLIGIYESAALDNNTHPGVRVLFYYSAYKTADEYWKSEGKY